MNLEILLPLITGSCGALVVLAAVLWGLYKLASRLADWLLSTLEGLTSNVIALNEKTESMSEKLDRLFEQSKPKRSAGNSKKVYSDSPQSDNR